ncbi:arsenate reductase ArsC [Shewanella surugensis]|uniref:Arsenate reductase ArsC n=1 Tax=Shewanella surugensis TaxID=212020 RepID=A0ABT0L9A4_9GAMM|nr:arsenate reductase ArsC [Shewanella surugensis]MCL1123955.1 arsenate reductase ArsC [Shewanella surugensis]
MNILVVCTGNACRSQMLHGFLKQYLGFNVYSAGIETHGVNPIAIHVMKEINIDISSHTSNLIHEYSDVTFDYLITVCDRANEFCPIFSNNIKKIHQSFDDPGSCLGTENQILAEFRRIREQINLFSNQLHQALMLPAS